MKEVPENELLSAYLDGELTAAEQVEVERLLAASPAARQLLEELRALSSTLQTLPQHKLGEDISQRVLRMAERRMLTEPAAPGKLPVPSEGHRNAPPNGRPSPTRRETNLRRALIPGALVRSGLVAAAVALLVLIGLPRQQERRSDGIARIPETIEQPESPSSMQRPAEEEDLQRDLADAKRGRGSIRHDTQARGQESAGDDAGQTLPVRWDILLQCDIGPEAHRKRVFDKALADNGIVWEESRDDETFSAGIMADTGGQGRKPTARQEGGYANRPAGDDALPVTLDVVYVEAPWDQIQGMLTALEAQPVTFSLALPEPAEEAKAWKDLKWRSLDELKSQSAGGAGALGGYRAKSPAAEETAVRPKQRGGGPDEVRPRAYARWIPFPGPDLNVGLESPNGDPRRVGSVVPTRAADQRRKPEQRTPKAVTVPPAARNAVPPAAGNAVPPAARNAVPPAARNAVPPIQAVEALLDKLAQQRTRDPAPAGQSQQRETNRTKVEVPMFRVLFVLRVTDLKSQAVSVEDGPTRP